MIGAFDTSGREVTIVGAGSAGMLAAYALDRQGYEVTLLEEREGAGGLVQAVHTEYGMAERAAHSLLAFGLNFPCSQITFRLVKTRVLDRL